MNDKPIDAASGESRDDPKPHGPQTGADTGQPAGNAPASQRMTHRRPMPGGANSPRRSPDCEGGQPVDELDLDGDGARGG